MGSSEDKINKVTNGGLTLFFIDFDFIYSSVEMKIGL